MKKTTYKAKLMNSDEWVQGSYWEQPLRYGSHSMIYLEDGDDDGIEDTGWVHVDRNTLEIIRENEIDNIEIILPFIDPKSMDDFYFLQILKRKKENPELGSNSVVIRNYYIKSKEHLLKVYPEVKEICRVTNSRAMIQLNKRSFENVAYKTLENMANCFMNKDFINMSNQYDRAIGQTNADKNKKWIVDIDKPFIKQWHDLLTFFTKNLQPVGEKELAVIPSKSGYHLISSPFNIEEFSKTHSDIDIQKNNPTNLFIP